MPSPFHITGAPAACLAVACLSCATPAQAAPCWSEEAAAAAQLKQLETMLMVTALRCRTGSSDFLADYNRFVDTNRGELGRAGATIRARIAPGASATTALNRYDSFVIGIANHYGSGHESLGCGELKAEVALAGTHTLARPALLDLAARLVPVVDLTGGRCPANVTYAARR